MEGISIKGKKNTCSYNTCGTPSELFLFSDYSLKNVSKIEM